MNKQLGKISSVYFGIGGYQDAMIGIHFDFSMDGSGVGDSKCAWDAETVKWSKNCQWDEYKRNEWYAEIVRYISKLLKDAKKTKVEDLKGVPVELTFDGDGLCGSKLESWRILTEVI